jgi:hypothetical protein
MLRAASGRADVVQAASVCTFEGQDLVVEVDLPEGQVYRIEFRFVLEDGGVEYVSHELEPWGLRLYCVNLGAIPRGSTFPILLGYLGEAPYYFHFRVEPQGGGPDRLVHYTLFRVREPAEQVGSSL